MVVLLGLLLAVPAASEKVKPLTPEEMRITIRNLEETVEEQQERLRLHKLEIEALRKTVRMLESRLQSLEQRAAAPAESAAN
jgi:predicted RNase H-like nuclease (RuvC/YqgF family)